MTAKRASKSIAALALLFLKKGVVIYKLESVKFIKK